MAKEDDLKKLAPELRRLAASGSSISAQAKTEFTDFAEEMTDIIEGRRARAGAALLVIAEAAENRAGEALIKAQTIIVKLKDVGDKDKQKSGDPPPDPDPGPDDDEEEC